MNRLQRISIPVTTAAVTGNANVDSAPIMGEICKIVYDKGTVNAATTVITTIKSTVVAETVDSYDINGGSAARYVRAAVQGAAAGDNKWCKFAADDKLNISVTGGAISKTFTVHIFYR